MKKIFLSGISILCFASSMTMAGGPTTDQMMSVHSNTKTQIGAALEERAAYINGYVFFNQLLNDKFFYELRGYYIHNLILAAPTIPAGLPAITSQRNLDGTGFVGILGYNIKVNPTFNVMPFIRLQYLTNTTAAYKDTAGNELDSDTFTSFLGLKLSMKVNEAFSVYAQYFGGYQTSRLYGKGLFATSARPKVTAWTSTLEFGTPYKITKSWVFTPYIQWGTTSNNPNAVAFAAPIKQSGATSTSTVFAAKLGYAF